MNRRISFENENSKVSLERLREIEQENYSNFGRLLAEKKSNLEHINELLRIKNESELNYGNDIELNTLSSNSKEITAKLIIAENAWHESIKATQEFLEKEKEELEL